jgi:hypothetical protein
MAKSYGHGLIDLIFYSAIGLVFLFKSSASESFNISKIHTAARLARPRLSPLVAVAVRALKKPLGLGAITPLSYWKRPNLARGDMPTVLAGVAAFRRPG